MHNCKKEHVWWTEKCIYCDHEKIKEELQSVKEQLFGDPPPLPLTSIAVAVAELQLNDPPKNISRTVADLHGTTEVIDPPKKHNIPVMVTNVPEMMTREALIEDVFRLEREAEEAKQLEGNIARQGRTILDLQDNVAQLERTIETMRETEEELTAAVDQLGRTIIDLEYDKRRLKAGLPGGHGPTEVEIKDLFAEFDQFKCGVLNDGSKVVTVEGMWVDRVRRLLRNL